MRFATRGYGKFYQGQEYFRPVSRVIGSAAESRYLSL
jgi:hypothetical protein